MPPTKLIISGSSTDIARDIFNQLPSGSNVIDIKLFQSKQHKKKRINKKWKEKYGYTCIIYYE